MFARIVPCLSRFCRSLVAAITLGTMLLVTSAAAVAERPSSMKLFPEETLVFIRMANAKEFADGLRDSSTGRMLADPQVKPFVEQLLGDAAKLYTEQAEQFLGIPWDELQKLPQGEVAFAIVAREDRIPAFLLLVDQGEEGSVASSLVDRALKFAGEQGGELSTEEIGDVEVTVVRDADDENRVFGLFERDKTIVVATDPNVLRGVLYHWDAADESAEATEGAETVEETDNNQADDEETADDDAADDDNEEEDDSEEEEVFVPGRTLAENSRFASILQQCRRPQDPPPHLVYFADPIELVRNFGRDQGGLQVVMGLLPSLGVDGLIGVGGSFTGSTDEYDDLSHFHVLLENPRSGVMQLPAFEEGDTAPQPFVPRETETYMSWNWNMRVFYDRLAALVDQFRYEGSVDKLVEERLSEPLGINFQTDVIDNLAGRYTWMIGYDRPAKFRGQQHGFAIAVKDEAAAAETLKTIMAKVEAQNPNMFEERSFGKITYHSIVIEGLQEMEEDERPVDPFVGIMDGYLFIGGSRNQFERCIAARDGLVDRMVDSEDYARVAAVLGRETAGTTPVMLSISRFEETVRQWYELLTSERTRELIDENKEDNPALAALSDALEQHQLPPFDVLAPYLAPGGAIFYDTDNGYHAIGFTLRNETPQ
jgi:hypothetical protein